MDLTQQRSVDLKEEVKEGNAEDTAKEEREATGKRNEEPKKRSRTENESAEAQEVPDDWVKVGPSCSHVDCRIASHGQCSLHTRCGMALRRCARIETRL